MRTCKWCGKQFDEYQAIRGGVRYNYSYCSKRCENAGERARKKEEEEFNQFMKSHPLFILLIIGICAVVLLIVVVKNRDNNNQRTIETVQEGVVAQSSSEKTKPLQSVKQDEVDIDKGAEDLMVDKNDIEAVEEFLLEESDITIIDEEMLEDNEVSIIGGKDFSKQKVYDVVDEMPVFPGGDHELLKYIADNLKYPQEAMESGVQGRVFVQIIVEPDGSISNPKIIRGIGYGCDEEAVRVVESIPGFNPGKKKEEVVRVLYTIPVVFEIQ